MNIAKRKPIWKALSELYLDSELQECDFLHIAFKIIESPYSLCEVKEINKYEVFPVLRSNLTSIAGEWKGFDEEWLAGCITNSMSKKNTIQKIRIESCFLIFKWAKKSYRKNLKMIYARVENYQPPIG